jgi:hypothetical protein
LVKTGEEGLNKYFSGVRQAVKNITDIETEQYVRTDFLSNVKLNLSRTAKRDQTHSIDGCEFSQN